MLFFPKHGRTTTNFNQEAFMTGSFHIGTTLIGDCLLIFVCLLQSTEHYVKEQLSATAITKRDGNADPPHDINRTVGSLNVQP